MKHPLSHDDLAGVHLVPLTPLDERGRVNEEVLATHIRRLGEAGVRIFLPAAATSGFYQLNEDEISRVVEVTVRASPEGSRVFAPVDLHLERALSIGERAREAGASGLMFMPVAAPYLADDGLKTFYTEVLDRVGLPALIYKKGALPGAEMLLDLAHHPGLVGIKYACRDVEEFHHTVERDRGRLAWLCGLAERYANAFLAQGAIGFTSGAGNLVPRLSLRLHEELAAGNLREARHLQELILPIERFRGREGDSYNISMLQYGMQCLPEPLDFGEPRLPLRRLTPAEREEVRAMLRPILEEEARLAHS